MTPSDPLSSEVLRKLWPAIGLAVLAFTVVFVQPPAALAQEGEAEGMAAGDDAIKEEIKEEITVTARKREEALQEVPFSVVAPSEEILRDRGAENLEDVSANVAGFTVQNLGPGQSQVAMRGISSGQIVRDQPGVKEQVGIYLDESPISLSLFTPDLDLFDVSRVEVLRGPQGTLFGSGSLSGTVRYITHRPEIGVSESFGEFTVDSADGGGVGGSAKVAVNAPVGDTAALRVAAYYTSYGGYMDAVQPDLSVDEDVNSGDRVGVRLALRSAPNDRLVITPRIIYQELDMDGWNRIDDFNILANPFTTTRPAVNLGERQLFTQFEEATTDDFLLADLTIEYLFGDVLLTSVTSYSDRDILVVRDAGALTASINGGSIGLPESVYTIDAPLDDATTVTTLTQELRLSGGGERTDWLVGAFFSDIERDYGQSLIVAGFEDMTGFPTQGPRAGRDELFFSDLDYKFQQLAVFGEVTYSVNDRLDLTAGLRWYDFDEDRTQVFDGFFVGFQPTAGSTTADGVAPRVIASYKVSDNTRLNAQISKGFRLGGINDPLNIPLCTPEDLVTFSGFDNWKDEEVWNYEVGVKSTVGGGRGTFNLAVFLMDITDLQATVTAGSCSSRLVFNVPESESRGLELEVAMAPSEHFDFAVSASYTDSELQSEAAGNISGISPGNRLPTVPKLQIAAAATYQWHLRDERLGYLTAVYQYVGSRYTQVGDFADGFGTVDMLSFEAAGGGTIGGPLTQQFFTFNPELPSYDVVNLRLGIRAERWEASLFVNNLTDEIAFLALDQERGSRARVGYLTNPPRTFGLTTRVKF
jgi:iron complex outermembrane receptor protein